MEQPYKATVSIAGTCILRDTFSTHKDDGGYKVQRYISRFSPLSLCEPPIPVDKEAYLAFDLKKYIPAFPQRCILQDLTRTSIDFLREQKSDWLLVDAALFRRDYFQFGEEQYTCYGAEQFIFDDLAKHQILPPVTGVKRLSDFSPEEIERRMQYYIDQLLSVYPLEQIILIENKNVNLQCDKNKIVQAFEDRDSYLRENENITRCYQLMKQMLQGCHHIPMPKYVIGNSNHWLGKSPLHYTQAYYDYSFQAVEVINRRLPRQQEEKEIAALREACSQKYLEYYFPLLEKAQIRLITDAPTYRKERDRYYQYVDYMGKVLQTGKTLKKLFQRKRWKRIAFYGWNRIAECCYKALQGTRTKVVFVVENLSADRKKQLFPEASAEFVLPRNAEQYPDVDAIIITDIVYQDAIRRQQQNQTKILIYTAYDLLS